MSAAVNQYEDGKSTHNREGNVPCELYSFLELSGWIVWICTLEQLLLLLLLSKPSKRDSSVPTHGWLPMQEAIQIKDLETL